MQTSEDFSSCRRASPILYSSNSLVVCGTSALRFELFLCLFTLTDSTRISYLKEIKRVSRLVCNIRRAAFKRRSNPFKGEETNNVNRDTNMDDRH